MIGAPNDSWSVAIHASATDDQPLGAGVVVDRSVVLTCAHILGQAGEPLPEVWIAFPKASGVSYLERRRVPLPGLADGWGKHVDLALLELTDPVPATVIPARLRCLPNAEIVGHRWWAFGFPYDAGSEAHGTIGSALSYGGVYLERQSPHGIAPGFSGSGLWSFEYEAVVGIVVAAAAEGDGQALTLFHADQQFPEWKLSTLAAWQVEDADDTALAAWGWTLTGDSEAHRHWLPRSRGVAVSGERGSRFRGREVALRRIVAWLDAPVESAGVLIVTGSPGVGKSAVLGRVVATADPIVRAGIPADDPAILATVGSVACAVHAKGKSAAEVAKEIARAASAAIPEKPGDLVPALRHRLTRRRERFNLVIDALDEAASPAEARAVVRDIVLPLGRGLAGPGVRILVATRRRDDQGDLLAEMPGAELLDLDSADYFAEPDLAAYVVATLQSAGADRPRNPYGDDRVAMPVAERIAALSRGNFLVAGLVARTRALRDDEPLPAERVAFTATVGDALDRYVDGLPAAGPVSARHALTALAFADTPGLPLNLWQIAIEALGGRIDVDDLVAFAHTSAANFLVEAGTAAEPVYRLFHQALNEALLSARATISRPSDDEARLFSAWFRYAVKVGWAGVPDYLRRSLSRHAARADLIDTLLNEDGFLLHADLGRLLPAAESARTEIGQARVELLQRTSRAVSAGPGDRAALFSVVDKLDGLGCRLEPSAEAPYTALWARTPRRQERMVLEGHADAVHDVASLTVDGRSLLASAGEDGKVRLRDPVTGQSVLEIDAHSDCIRGLSVIRTDAALMLATAGEDTTVKVWDPRTGRLLHTLRGHTDWVRNLCSVRLGDGRELLASASDDRTVRVWDTTTGQLVHTLRGHRGWVTAVCQVPMPDGSTLLASTGFDGTIRVWDPADGTLLRTLTGHDGWVTTLYAARTDQTAVLASAGYDGTVRLWDPWIGSPTAVFDTGAGVMTDVCTVVVNDMLVVAATGEDGVVRLWDVVTGIALPSLEGHSTWIRAICEVRIGTRSLLATAGNDETVRLWDPVSGRPGEVTAEGFLGAVPALAATRYGGHPAVVAASEDGGVQIFHPVTGEKRHTLLPGGSGVTQLCAFGDDDLHLLATAANDTVTTWDLDNDDEVGSSQVHFESVNAVQALRLDGRTALASAADDRTVRICDPSSGVELAPPRSHPAWVTALAIVPGDRPLLASGDNDGTIRVWAPFERERWVSPGYGEGVNVLVVYRDGERTVLVSAGVGRHIKLWDAADGTLIRTLSGHRADVTGVCLARVAGRSALVSTSLDRTVRVWDPGTGRLLRTVPVYHRALTCRVADDVLVIGLDRGLLALEFS